MVVQYTRTVTVRKIHVTIRTDRTDRQSGIRSVMSILRSVNCISFVGLKIFSWQERNVN